MESKSIKSFLHKNWPWLLPILPSLVLALLLYKHGIRLTYDSDQFLCAAKSFRQIGSLNVCDGGPMVLSAIGFPLLLSLFDNPAQTYSFISPLLYWLTVSCWLFVLKVRNLPPSLFATVPILVGLPLFFPFLFLWSEGPFLAFFSLGILAIEQYRTTQNKRYLIVLLFCFPTAVSLRYAGLFIIIPALIWAIIQERKKGRLYFMASFALVMLVAITMAARNWSISHTLFGVRAAASFSFLQILYQCAEVIANWLVPVSIFGKLSVALTCILLFLLLKTEPQKAFLMGTYFILMVGSASCTEVEHDERLFVPIYPLFVIAVSGFFLKGNRNWVMHSIFWLWSAYLAARFIKNILFWAN